MAAAEEAVAVSDAEVGVVAFGVDAADIEGDSGEKAILEGLASVGAPANNADLAAAKETAAVVLVAAREVGAERDTTEGEAVADLAVTEEAAAKVDAGELNDADFRIGIQNFSHSLKSWKCVALLSKAHFWTFNKSSFSRSQEIDLPPVHSFTLTLRILTAQSKPTCKEIAVWITISSCIPLRTSGNSTCKLGLIPA